MSRARGKMIETLGLWIGLSLVPVVFLETLRRVAGAPFSPGGMLLRWGLVVGVLLAARLGALQQAGKGRWLWPWSGPAILAATAAAALWYAGSRTTWPAWLALGGWWALLLSLVEGVWRLAAGRRRGARFLWRLIALGIASAVGGLIPAAVGQIESRFADEEFFVLLQALALAAFVGLMLVVHLWLSARQTSPPGRCPPRGLCLAAWWVLIGLGLLVTAGGWATARLYQASFYPPDAPAFEGISPDSPFLCGETASPAEERPDGETVFRRLLNRIEANPDKRPPEYGALALGAGEQRWAEAFRASLLAEAAEGRFTGPAHSVKSVQYDAALRLYYLWRVQAAFPDLLTEAEQATLRAWFAAINARALTVEWVDWNYALAFARWPEGPYENQENGAGLLALLEATGYAAPELSAANRDYLARNERGWAARFRNTDDALVYQPEWIANALFQSLYTGRFSERNRRLAFEWLLLQSLPDGAMGGYNHPVRAPLAGVAYLGASLLHDPRLLWLADRSLAQVEATDGYLYAQPGVEAAVTWAGQPPSAASCLLYGDSGLPNQVGPLAPDKIILRDGWSSDAAYLMLNLRFTGWHRYKATNAVALLYRAGPLVAERASGQPFAWLPEGRSLFRDKRIPRENLNGLLIQRSGVSAVLYGLTGLGGPWAQDPPPYARVERFETLGPLDVSRTALDDWRGWQQRRTIYFFHGGPVVVVDTATSRREGATAALSWGLVGEGRREGESLWLRGGEQAARVVWPAEAWPSMTVQSVPADSPDQPNLHALYRSPREGRLDLATTWLFGAWADSQSQVTTLREGGSDRVLGYRLRLSGEAGSLELLHNATSERLEAGGLATDGEAVLVWQAAQAETTVCIVGGRVAEVALADRPGRVATLAGEALPAGEAWEWGAGRLVIRNAGEARCLEIR